MVKVQDKLFVFLFGHFGEIYYIFEKSLFLSLSIFTSLTGFPFQSCCDNFVSFAINYIKTKLLVGECSQHQFLSK